MCLEVLEGFRFGDQLKYSTENFATSYSAVFVTVMNKDKVEFFTARYSEDH